MIYLISLIACINPAKFWISLGIRIFVDFPSATFSKVSKDFNAKISFVNNKAFEGTLLAHIDGGVPNLVINIPEVTAFNIGYLIYFFEKACAISGYLLEVNPFDQPGVESYKKNMFALLGKKGYEELSKELNERLKK